MNSTPSFLDFEASSLSAASYPVEVAWSTANGPVESHLISPAHVAAWTDWDAGAQALHGLSRAELLAQGRPPSWVVHRMNEQLAGRVVYSDNPDYDGFWLGRLFEVAGDIEPEFGLAEMDELLVDLVCPQAAGRVHGLNRIEAMKRVARREVAGQHRAGWDVEYLLVLYGLAQAANSADRGDRYA